MKCSVIEMCGLPGAGKTTLVESILQNQIFSNKIVKRAQLVRFVSTPVRRSIYFLLMICRPSCWNFYLVTKRFSKQYKKYSIKSLFTLFVLYDYVKFCSLFHLKRTLLLEEGFVQNITSIPHENKLNDDRYLNYMINMINSACIWHIVYCKLDYYETICRLRKRNNNDRFNSIMDDNELKSLLEIKQNNIELVLSKCMDYEEIQMNSVEVSKVSLNHD